MTTIKFTREKRKFFTRHGLTPSAVLQLREYSWIERDIADGEGGKHLRERGLCDDRGMFNIDREEAKSLVTAAYSEGWHEKY